jgi:hypothetical protein
VGGEIVKAGVIVLGHAVYSTHRLVYTEIDMWWQSSLDYVGTGGLGCCLVAVTDH